ncbi:hypothetical protein [Methylibium sp.]|uniref:hypothetical protein n=1 Tax=Methylibium sp. TaxID=2067992 RepID=UPI00286D3DCA|nr:hypothetical protein [Methylibium sp.]
MQSYYAEAFERDMGCTEAEWLGWLPGACAAHALAIDGGTATVAIDEGALHLRWSPLPSRQIALMRMPRLAVGFRFEGLAEASRQRFMRYFDLYTQRGGG